MSTIEDRATTSPIDEHLIQALSLVHLIGYILEWFGRGELGKSFSMPLPAYLTKTGTTHCSLRHDETTPLVCLRDAFLRGEG